MFGSYRQPQFKSGLVDVEFKFYDPLPILTIYDLIPPIFHPIWTMHDLNPSYPPPHPPPAHQCVKLHMHDLFLMKNVNFT